jgi:hypothetical protein
VRGSDGLLESDAGLTEFVHNLQQIGDALGRLLIQFVLLLLVVDDETPPRLVQSAKDLLIQNPA